MTSQIYLGARCLSIGLIESSMMQQILDGELLSLLPYQWTTVTVNGPTLPDGG